MFLFRFVGIGRWKNLDAVSSGFHLAYSLPYRLLPPGTHGKGPVLGGGHKLMLGLDSQVGRSAGQGPLQLSSSSANGDSDSGLSLNVLHKLRVTSYSWSKRTFYLWASPRGLLWANFL